MHFSALKFQDFLGKHAPRKRPPFCLSKARKTNLFNATVKEAKVKDFAILFLALSWFHQGNHKNCLLIFQRAHWLIFAETFFLHTFVSLRAGSEINFLIRAPTGDQVQIFGRQRANCGRQNRSLNTNKKNVWYGSFYAQKFHYFGSWYQRATVHVRVRSYFFHNLLFGDINTSLLCCSIQATTADIWVLCFSWKEHGGFEPFNPGGGGGYFRNFWVGMCR